MHSRIKRKGPATFAVAALIAGGAFAGCGTNNDDNSSGGSSGSSGGGNGSIALLLPESKTARYESQDRPLFTKKANELCPKCKVIYSNADQDASKQQQQAEAAITKGAKVLVLDPVDAASAAGIVQRAKQSKIPVISYDRLVAKAPVDYYISFDNRKVGELQAQSLVDKLGSGKSTIAMINGSPTDSNAAQFKAGAHSVLDKASNIKIGKEYDTPDWSPDKAQDEMEQAITSLGKNGFQGVYAANDGTAGGAIAAMKSNGVDPATKPVTGQDAELSGVQRVVLGDQYMTVYKPYKPEAETAAKLAVELAQGKKPDTSKFTEKTNNGSQDVPSYLLPIIAVTKDKVQGTIVKDGLWTAKQICTGQYAAACKEAGVK